MEKDIRTKIRVLETKKMTAQLNADKQEKVLKLYPKLPSIFFLIVFLGFFIWGFIDSWTNEKVVVVKEGVQSIEKVVYGIWGMPTRFNVCSTWALLGACIGVVVFLVLKVIVSIRIVTVEYLKILSLDRQIEEKKNLLKKLPPNPDN